MTGRTIPPTQNLEQAKADAERAKQRLSTSMSALQHKLRPGNLANDAWSGVKEKGGVIAEDAIQAVKDRPVTASGVLAAVVIFLAREPLWAVASGFFRNSDDSDLVTTKLTKQDKDYDLTAPTVKRPAKKGVIA